MNLKHAWRVVRGQYRSKAERAVIERADRVAAASSADVHALSRAIWLLDSAAGSTSNDKARTLNQSAVSHLVLQLRDAQLWRSGDL